VELFCLAAAGGLDLLKERVACLDTSSYISRPKKVQRALKAGVSRGVDQLWF
jgi:hypothetical protein